MLQKLTLQCKYADDLKPSYNWGSLLHGVLMELLPGEVAEALHESGLRPFSQYIVPLADSVLEWRLGLWDDAISNEIVKAVMPLSKIPLKHKNSELTVLSTNRNQISEEDYITSHVTHEEGARRYELEFITPCTHKSGGRYVLFPSVELIYQSLQMRFDSFSNEFSLGDSDSLIHLSNSTQIVRYNLRSEAFYLENYKIPCYKGRLTLAVRGPETLCQLAGMLLGFSEYAGIGIKTSMGMGGCKCVKTDSIEKKTDKLR